MASKDAKPTEIPPVRADDLPRIAVHLHDLANVIHAVGVHADLLREGPDSEERAADYDALMEGARRAARLVRELRGLTERSAEDTASCSVASVLLRARRIIEVVLGSSIELRIDCRLGAAVRIAADELLDVVLNAAVNARDAMRDGGRFVIDASLAVVSGRLGERLALGPGRFGLIRLRDTGCGMDAATLARAFDPFFTTKGETGAGLGLSSIHTKIVPIGGAVRCASAHTRGTCLSLYVPVAADDA